LNKLLSTLPKIDDPNLLVGFSGSDDAGVYRLNDEMAVVTTADFITPPVDDPYLFGQIAAANAMSDVYAMGGKPLICLNLVCFPSKKLPDEVLHRIVAGALSKITEAGALLAGGHSVDDDEPKFGLAVTGMVHPDKIWTNAGANPGDVLILTKPLGSGVLFNADLKNLVSKAAMDECIKSLTALNKAATEIMSAYDIHAATDVTGFGLAGHGLEMAKASSIHLEIETGRIPLMREALEMYEKGVSTGVNPYNRRMVKPYTQFDNPGSGRRQEILFDPQTSGGLLVAVENSQADDLLIELHNRGIERAAIIGEVKALADSNYLRFR
jgi:selenide,water dikinase